LTALTRSCLLAASTAPEAEQRRVERDDLADRAVDDPEHVDRQRRGAIVAGRPDVARDGRLAARRFAHVKPE
jgi:hypothetical protein